MGKHAGPPGPDDPVPPPQPSRRELRREYERLYAHYTELAANYRELLAATTAVSTDQPTEEISVSELQSNDLAFSWGRS